MIAELRKHAHTSRALDRLTKEKSSGALLRGIGTVGKKVGAWGLAHPIQATTAVLGGAAAAGKARSTYNNMRPGVLRAQLGMTST